MATPTPSAALDGFKTEFNLGAVASMTGTVKGHFHVTNDTKAQVETAGYFNPCEDYITDGDIIFVAGDRDGTKFLSSYVVTKPGSGDLTLTEHAAVTQNVLQVATVRVTALGTASNHYIPSPVAGSLTAVYGVSNAANGTLASTIGISIDGGDKATLTFSDSYVAGAVVSDVAVDANTLTLGEAILIDNNGEGDGTGEVTVLLVFTPS
jgi:hypothetical protein